MKYRKKSVEIEAMQLKNPYHIIKEIMDWIHCGLPPEANSIAIWYNTHMTIRTLEGEMTAALGDWIIKGVKGEFYPIKNDIFLETYEKVEEVEEIEKVSKNISLIIS